jgi:hypothetical protein
LQTPAPKNTVSYMLIYLNILYFLAWQILSSAVLFYHCSDNCTFKNLESILEKDLFLSCNYKKFFARKDIDPTVQKILLQSFLQGEDLGEKILSFSKVLNKRNIFCKQTTAQLLVFKFRINFFIVFALTLRIVSLYFLSNLYQEYLLQDMFLSLLSLGFIWILFLHIKNKVPYYWIGNSKFSPQAYELLRIIFSQELAKSCAFNEYQELALTSGQDLSSARKSWSANLISLKDCNSTVLQKKFFDYISIYEITTYLIISLGLFAIPAWLLSFSL